VPQANADAGIVDGLTSTERDELARLNRPGFPGDSIS
jgi:hypothetical protein